MASELNEPSISTVWLHREGQLIHLSCMRCICNTTSPLKQQKSRIRRTNSGAPTGSGFRVFDFDFDSGLGHRWCRRITHHTCDIISGFPCTRCRCTRPGKWSKQRDFAKQCHLATSWHSCCSPRINSIQIVELITCTCMLRRLSGRRPAPLRVH